LVTNRSCQSRATAIRDDISVSDTEFRGERAGAAPGAAETIPPAGVFLVGYVRGEAVACGGVRPRPEGHNSNPYAARWFEKAL
jgi:hypothetical protein